MTMLNEIIEDEVTQKELKIIFRRNIPNTSRPKKDAQRMKYCQRCGKLLTHFLSQNERNIKEGEILKLKTPKKIYKWINKHGVYFKLCELCYIDMTTDDHSECDISEMTLSGFKATYKLSKSKQGKVYDYIKRYNSEV